MWGLKTSVSPSLRLSATLKRPLSWQNLLHVRALRTYYVIVYYCLNLRIPDCLLLNIIIIVAVFVVKCCDSRDCLLMLLFWWLNFAKAEIFY